MTHVSKRPRFLRTHRWVLLGIGGVLGLVIGATLIVANSQDGPVRVLQAVIYWKLGTEPNSFKPLHPPVNAVRNDGLRIRTEVEYSAQYPNSFLDIWYATADIQVKRPTIIFLHGGGFFMGSKDWGDPFAGGGKDGALDEPIALMAKQGFNVVNLDYALAPAYRYPVPLIQLNQAIGFLRAHADQYGLDMTRVFIMGGSAGAQLSAQYGAVLSDRAYAADVGIRPTIDLESVNGLVIFSAPLEVHPSSWPGDAMAWAYLGTKNLKNSWQVRQVDILAHVTPRFPATYITDGNQSDTFPEQAKAMARLLARDKVDYVFNYYEASRVKLHHDYTGRVDTKYGRQNLERAIAFMKRRAGPGR